MSDNPVVMGSYISLFLKANDCLKTIAGGGGWKGECQEEDDDIVISDYESEDEEIYVISDEAYVDFQIHPFYDALNILHTQFYFQKPPPVTQDSEEQNQHPTTKQNTDKRFGQLPQVGPQQPQVLYML